MSIEGTINDLIEAGWLCLTQRNSWATASLLTVTKLFPRRKFMRKITFIKSGRVWATAPDFGIAVFVTGGSAMAQSGPKAMEYDMAQHKATMMDGSKRMMEEANMMREAVKMMETNSIG